MIQADKYDEMEEDGEEKALRWQPCFLVVHRIFKRQGDVCYAVK
jgi:hypothetical protein